MAFTSQQIRDYLIGNPGMTDAQIVAAMETFQISPAQMASAVGLDEGAVAARVGATVAPGMSVTLGDTVVTPQYQYIQSGEDNQVGALETVFTSKTTGDPNYKAPVGTPIQIYSATGDFINTVKTKKDLSFFGGIVDALKDPYVQAAILGATAGASGLFSGAGTAATVGTTGLTAAEIASLTAGDLAIGGGAFAVPTAVGATAAGLTAAEIAALTAQDLAIGGGALAGTTPLTAAQIAALTAQDLAIGGGPLAGTPPTTIPGLLSPPVVTVAPTGVPPTGVPPTGVPPTGVPPTGVPPIGVPPTGVPPTGVPPTGVPPTGVPPIGVPPIGVPPIGVPTIPDITKLVQSGLTAAQIAALFQSTAQTGAGLLQQQTSREAAQKAQQMIDAETAAAKQSAAFRPIGMTTRFGTSQFQVDPVTGQLTSAGYTLSPEAKNAQDRFLTLAGAGLTQAEQAQQQFAPLQTGAQRLFGLGNQYLAQNPQEVAQNYLNQQMALLQPGRETELANLQNRLQQQGRGGLSVAQGGTLGATTPELQALYNARATQEAQLAAQAQQAGQQQVAFGAGLLGTGAQTMGQYYGGQQAAYTPYTTALGQVQGLEQMAQQPFGMSTALAQQASQAGANVGRLGLSGAEFSTRLATSPAATTNPYSTVLGGVGASNQFGQFVGGLFGGVPATTAMSAPATTFGTGNYYGSQDLGLYL